MATRGVFLVGKKGPFARESAHARPPGTSLARRLASLVSQITMPSRMSLKPAFKFGANVTCQSFESLQKNGHSVLKWNAEPAPAPYMPGCTCSAFMLADILLSWIQISQEAPGSPGRECRDESMPAAQNPGCEVKYRA